jgi:NTP pyrophosphatase (non-canonical NTP hydrolase)
VTDLRGVHEMVWSFRREMEAAGGAWQTPPPQDSLRYACTEAGEAMDAWLRAQRPDDGRNTTRQRDLLAELADCAIMLLSAVPAFERLSLPATVAPGAVSIDGLAATVGAAVGLFAEEEKRTQDGAAERAYMLIGEGLMLVDRYPGMALRHEVTKRLQRLLRKHLDGAEGQRGPVMRYVASYDGTDR